MRTLNLLLCLILLTSCSVFQKREIDYSESFITGLGTEKLTSEAIKKNLLRSISMAGGSYQISSFPISTAYLNSYSREQAEVKGLSKRNSTRLKKNLEKRFLNRKACIETQITVKEFEKVNKLSEWDITLIDSNNIAYKLEWLTESPSSSQVPPTVTTTRHSYHGKEKMWSLQGQACAVAEVEMKKGFKIIFKPSFVQWPFSDKIEEEWSFNYTQIVQGKKVLKKKKERKKEGYRGW